MAKKNAEPSISISDLGMVEALYGKGGVMTTLMKASLGEEGRSISDKKTSYTGTMPWPFDKETVNQYRYGSNMHGRAIEAKCTATVGLGFAAPEVEDLLDPLTDDDDILSTLTDICDDTYSLGNGFMEVVRESDTSEPNGLHHLQAVSMDIEREETGDYHFVAQVEGGDTVHLARWGEKARLANVLKVNQADISEVIHFPQVPSAWSRWYGVPTWITALPLIKVVQEIVQYNYDFFVNSAVPELLLLLTKGLVSKPDMDKLTALLKGSKGPGKRRKTLALNLPQENIEIDIEKLSEGKIDGGFLELMDRNDLGILAAHGVTPVIVGIQNSPKILGQTKEIRDNLQLVQALTIKPNQRMFTKRLKATLGQIYGSKIPDIERSKQEISGVTQQMVVEKETGWSFNKITDEIEFDMTPQLGGPNAAGSDSASSSQPN